ncbi:MAG TPA: bifunctional YncE family protein/alkaline phosphatase family protein [Thermoanaerobaculia bacterium]|nr:bifunctional YncE family protein/alkaline phosphatase family protein [Thermoanaerobaculia bacterium]
MLRQFAVLLLSLLLAPAAFGATKPAPRQMPGREGISVLLPNGWRIAPAGRHITVGDLPLAMAESPDGGTLVVTNNGYTKPSLTVVDLRRLTVPATVPVDDAWLGLVWHPDGKRLYASGGAASTVQELRVGEKGLEKTAVLTLKKPGPTSFVGGLAVSPDGSRLYAVHVLGQTLSAVDLGSGQVAQTVELPAEAYTALAAPDGKTVFVSLWGGAKVLVFDAATLALRGEVAVGEHPNAMILSKDGSRLFVACANTNEVWVVDVAAGSARAARERISIALEPAAPPGSTPNGLGLSPDGATLLVANADNNTVAVVDVSRPGDSRVRGFIPTGWYPTAAQFSRDGQRIFVLSGKGLTSVANPRGNQPGVEGASGQYIAELLEGSLSVLPVPDEKTLARYTQTVYRLTPYTAAGRLAPRGAPAGSPIPARVGGRSPIKYVFYVIRENRTYDQILGDLPQGNGDPNLCLFGEDVTPNAHALAREFALFDNFYVNAEVSYDGHAFSTGAYATDVVEKIWPMNYARRGGDYLSEGAGPQRNPYGNVAAPANGYLWDACNRARLSVRSYGEFVQWQDEKAKGKVRASVPGLEGKVNEDFPPYDLGILDSRRVEIWREEFRHFEAQGDLPRLSILRLPRDHTQGTRAGSPTPRAMIAENDQALGRFVEAVSHSRFWKESAIFVVEDDAQNGPDHVDAHRSVLLMISPYSRRGAVDGTLYTTAGVLRTMELILGLPPLSQYDAAATPMYRAFRSQPQLAPFDHREPRIPLDEKNAKSAWGAEASAAMDLDTEADLAPELALNEILWKSVRGASSPMPPPVHAAFVRGVRGGEKEGDDD